jgi:uroporphyrinogen-III synthase
VIAIALAGRRVLVTRALHQAGKLSEGLRALGAIAVEVPVLEIRPAEDLASLDAALKQLNSYDWLILTSANAVQALADRAAEIGVKLFNSNNLKVAAVGESTAEAARRAGFRVPYVPPSYVAESLSDGLAGRVAGERILLARAAGARDVIPDALRAAGATVEVVEAYQNWMPERAPDQLRIALASGIDGATFTSSSSVTHLRDAARAAGLEWPFAGVAAASIGPITSRTLRESGWEPAVEANPSDIPGLVRAVAQLFGQISGSDG